MLPGHYQAGISHELPLLHADFDKARACLRELHLQRLTPSWQSTQGPPQCSCASAQPPSLPSPPGTGARHWSCCCCCCFCRPPCRLGASGAGGRPPGKPSCRCSSRKHMAFVIHMVHKVHLSAPLRLSSLTQSSFGLLPWACPLPAHHLSSLLMYAAERSEYSVARYLSLSGTSRRTMETPDCCWRSVTCTVTGSGAVLLYLWASSACNCSPAHHQSDRR